jgi:hypothetical protein
MVISKLKDRDKIRYREDRFTVSGKRPYRGKNENCGLESVNI